MRKVAWLFPLIKYNGVRMAHQNRIWKGFLLFLTLIVMGFTITVLPKLYDYFRLNSAASPLEVQWSVVKESEERYLLLASYQFPIDAAIYSGKMAGSPIFRNLFAAEEEIHKYRARQWTVWYDSAAPEYSSLQKSFPVKECVSAVLLWGVLLYFYCLGNYVGKLQRENDVNDSVNKSK
jgi:hypothetical protein